MKCMETVKYSPTFLRKRKMMLVLPLIVLPFIVLGFWALGGGRASAADTKQNNLTAGLNLQLPNAHLKDERGLNKLSYYEIAAADSAKLKEHMRSDPYFKTGNITTSENEPEAEYDSTPIVLSSSHSPIKNPGLNNLPFNRKGADRNEEKIMRKLQQLNAALDITAAGTSPNHLTNENSIASRQPVVNKAETDRPDDMMQAMQQRDNMEDPEMKQISGMLDKIMDIQHPERLTNRIHQNSLVHKQQVYPVSRIESGAPVSLLENPQPPITDTSKQAKNSLYQNGFYGIGDNFTDSQNIESAVPAVIHETQSIVSGSTVKLRLLDDAYINGILVQKNNFVFGTAVLNGERMLIEIKSIRSGNTLLSVALSAYDLDGMDGIYVPGAIERNSAKESSDKAIQSIALNSLDPTIGAQAAGAGIEAAKTLLSKKVKLVRVILKAGYQVLLKNNNSK